MRSGSNDERPLPLPSLLESAAPTLRESLRHTGKRLAAARERARGSALTDTTASGVAALATGGRGALPPQ